MDLQQNFELIVNIKQMHKQLMPNCNSTLRYLQNIEIDNVLKKKSVHAQISLINASICWL